MGRLAAALDRLGALPSKPVFKPAQRWLLLLLTLAAALIRVSYQFDREFRGDEVGTLIHMDRSFRYLMTHCETWLTMNHFIALEQLVGQWLGRGPLALGALPLLAGVAQVPLLALLARRFFEPRVALMAAAMAALNPFLIDYSGRIRSYSLLAAASLWLLVAFLGWLHRRSFKSGLLTALAAVLLLLSHPLGIYPLLLVLGVAILEALPLKGRATGQRNLGTLYWPLCVGLAVVALCYGGLFGPIADESRRWHAGPVTSFEYLPFLMSGYFGRGPSVWVIGCLLLLGAGSAWRMNNGFGWLLLGLVLPSLLMSAQGLAHRPWAYQRMLIFQLPVLLLLLAQGLRALSVRRRGLTELLFVLLLVSWLPGLERLFDEKARLSGSPLLAAARFVEQHFQPGDRLLAERRQDLLHLQNHLPPGRFAALTLAQIVDGLERPRGRLFVWGPAELISAQPRLETAVGNMILYAGEPPLGALRALQTDLLTTIGQRPPDSLLADCYGLLCRLGNLLPDGLEIDQCALWKRYRVVKRRERIARIGQLFD